MRIDSEKLPRELARGVGALYAVVGFEPLLALEAGDRIRAAARAAGYTERELSTVESGFDWSAFEAASRNVSLFSSRRIVELRIPGGKPGVEGARALERYAAALPPDTVTLVVLPDPERAVLTAKWFTALENAGTIVVAAVVERARLADWIAARLARQEQTADDATLALLVERTEGNLLAAYQEIQKLALLFPPGPLARAEVGRAVLDVARYDVFEIGTVALAGDVARTVRMISGLAAEGVAEPLVLWSLVDPVRAMARVLAATASGRPVAQALKEQRVWGPRQTAMERALRRHDRDSVAGLLARAARADRTIKGLARGDGWDALLGLAVAIADPHGVEAGLSLSS